MMTAGELKKILEHVDPTSRVVIDNDTLGIVDDLFDASVEKMEEDRLGDLQYYVESMGMEDPEEGELVPVVVIKT